MAVKGRVTLTLTDNLAWMIQGPCWPLKFKIWPPSPSAKIGEAICNATVGYRYRELTVDKYDNEQAIDTDIGIRQ